MYSLDQLKTYLGELSRKIHGEGEKAVLLVFGGGALALVYGAREKTQDLDAVFSGSGAGLVRPYAVEIAHTYGIGEDWINDDGSQFVTPEIIADSRVFQRFSGLIIKVPSARALLAMKVLAMRIGPLHPDRSDIVFLMRQTGLYDADEVVALVDEYLSIYRNRITQSHRDWLAVLVEEAKNGRG